MKRSVLLKEIQMFLTQYCQQERRLSRLTILSYRDTMKIFLLYLQKIKKKHLYNIGLSILSYELISDFLLYLEKKRKVSISTRNQRLCAINSFLRYLLFKHPDYADTISRALNVPRKKKDKSPRTFLETDEIKILLNSVCQKTWCGSRDYLLIDFCICTGVRVSELVNLQVENVILGKAPYITVSGKRRKKRSIPVGKSLASQLSHWIRNNRLKEESYFFPSIRCDRMSTDAVQHLIRKYVTIAKRDSLTLKNKKVSPHTLRHTTAMNLLERGVDIQIIALWLGHEQIDTTQIYLSGSMTLKRKALKKTEMNIKTSTKRIIKSELDFLDEI
jgi:integrase/recombinase XerD